MKFDTRIMDWLLETSNPSIRYRTLTEILDRPSGDTDVADAQNGIESSEPVRFILSKKHPDGYWLQKNPRTGEVLGDGIAYGNWATTHFVLAYLSELGLDRSHPDVRKACDRYLDLIQPDGDFWNHYSCLLGYNIRNFIRLGYRDDVRLQKSIDLMLRTERHDGGYLCPMHEKRSKSKRSCIRGCLKCLLAYSEMPEYWDHPRVSQLLEYFLGRDCIFKKRDPRELVNKDVGQTVFPITWRAGLIEILLSMARMGYGGHPATARGWQLLDTKKNAEGKYILDWAPTLALLKTGKRGEPNKWVTFYALLALKHR